ncbi:MAG: TetR/AcrR family transcriptional regulator [Deltaproteobacteria bacterium]|jgi:AcrR family transcriptional regulator|nr:TetR/AcrR family transcriptional regulator [Deltaproteobacteria bacterium]MBW2535714.1 TetR/AcrR family transcriptional regulator [Deltaproteobacteria bacterium]
MSKGEATRKRVLEQALALASTLGFEGLSIGGLAKATDMSKSGLFAHFDSKEDLQIKALEHASESFVTHVILPALREPRGEPRVRALFDRWLTWGDRDAVPGGCPFIAAAYELDDRPGRLRDELVASQRDWVGTIGTAAKIAVEEGHFRSDLDTEQFAYELYGSFLAYHLYHRLLGDPRATIRVREAFERLIRSAK